MAVGMGRHVHIAEEKEAHGHWRRVGWSNLPERTRQPSWALPLLGTLPEDYPHTHGETRQVCLFTATSESCPSAGDSTKRAQCPHAMQLCRQLKRTKTARTKISSSQKMCSIRSPLHKYINVIYVKCLYIHMYINKTIHATINTKLRIMVTDPHLSWTTGHRENRGSQGSPNL